MRKGGRKRLIIFVVVKFQGVSDAPKHVFEEIPARALKGLAAHFLIVEAGADAYAAARRVGGEGLERRPHACEIVDAGRGRKFVIQSKQIGLVRVDDVKIVGDGVFSVRPTRKSGAVSPVREREKGQQVDRGLTANPSLTERFMCTAREGTVTKYSLVAVSLFNTPFSFVTTRPAIFIGRSKKL